MRRFLFGRDLRAAVCILTLIFVCSVRAASGPVAYYTFDEASGTVALDSSGNGYNGALTGGVTRVPGINGNALNFDGSTGYVEVPYSAALNTPQFTISVAVKLTGGQGTNRSVITSRNSSPTLGFVIYATDTNQWQFWTGANSNVTWNYLVGQNVTLNTWTFLSATYDGTTMRLYQNGVLSNSLTAPYTVNVNKPLRIGAGATEGTPQFFFPGLIDDVRVYNRALSAAEIAQALPASVTLPDTYSMVASQTLTVAAPGVMANDISFNGNILSAVRDTDVSHGTLNFNADGSFVYTPANGYTGADSFTYHTDNGSGGLSASTPVTFNVGTLRSGTVVLYSFDEGAGTAAHDSSGNGNDGALTNGPVWVAGVEGTALSFNGINQYINDASFNWPSGGPVTVAFWNYVAASQVQGSCAFGAGTGDPNRFQAHAPNSDSNIYWDYGNIQGAGRIMANYAPYLDKWTHVALVSAGVGGNFKAIYLNGQLVASASSSDGPQVPISILQVGHSAADPVGSTHHHGIIDDFQIYNRVLSAYEIQSLTTGSSPTTVAAVSAVASYGGTQTITLDANITASAAVNEGTVTFQIMNGATAIGNAATSGTVSNGNASVSYALPSGTSVGSYTISASYSGGATYAPSSDNTDTLTINKVSLTVNANNVIRAYGSANPTLTGSIVGIQNSDNITATYATSAGLTSIVGGYSIVPTLVDPGNRLVNYTVTSNNGTLTVSAAPLSVTPANLSRAYGAANPTLSGTITGIKNSDNITATYATSATVLSAVANYSIVPTLIDPSNKLSNYSVTSNNGTLTVTQAGLTAVAFNASRAYGAANPTFSGILSGVLNGDNILAAYNTTATPASSIGNYAITPSLLDPDGKQSNYSVTLSNGTLNVTTAPLSVAAANVSRPYGAANPTLTGTITGIQNNDNITATYATSATPQSLIGNYNIVPTLVDPGSKLSNYSVTSTNGTLTVGTAALTVTPTNVSKTYGDAIPVLGGTVSGVQNGDNITASYSTLAAPGSAVGPYSITAMLSDPGNKLPNYAVTLNTGTLTINTAPLSVSADNKSKTYGDPNPAFTGTLSGVVNGDAITASYSTSTTPGSAAGAYSIVPMLNDPGGKLGNYALTSTNGTLTINKAALSVTANNASRTYGAADPIFAGTLTGVVNADNITATYSAGTTAASPVATYPIVPTLVDPGNKLGNYALTSANGTLTITTAALSVSATNATRFYHAPDPVFTGTLAGIQNNDAISATYSSTATQTSAVGAYPISPALVDPNGLLGNYSVTSANGTLTIKKATPAIVWLQPAQIFAGVPLDTTQLNAAASDAFTNTAVTGTFAYAPDTGTVLAPGLGQTLSVTFTPDDATNYTIATAQTSIDVAPAIPPAITSALSASTAINADFAYTITADGSTPLAFSATGLPDGLMLNGADIGGNPTASGVFNVTLTATNYGGSDSKNLKLIVVASGTNHAPVIASPPTASANPSVVGTALFFSAQATDADGDALDYNWDFGDGTAADGASVSKIFAAPGVYIVTVTVSDGQASATQSVDLVINAQASQDTFAVTKIKLGFSFTKSGNDNLSLSGQIPLPPGFFPAGKIVRILIGGFDTSGTLNSKGTSGDKSFSLRSKKGSATASFSFTVKNRNLFTPLQGLGFSKTASNPSLIFPVIVVLDGTSHFASPALVYTVKVNKLGPQSGSGKH